MVTANPVDFALDGVSLCYDGGTPALRDLTLTVDAGERVAILGATGCGKSTLLKVLDGLVHPNEGSITAFGEPLTERRLRDQTFSAAFRARVGYLFQDVDTQLFCPTVREEIAFGPLHAGMLLPDVEARCADLVDMLGIGDLVNRPPFRLSGGEKKKVAIACTLATNPDVLLLDEPSANLDPRTQGWLLALLSALHAAGKTLVTSTQDLSIVRLIADRAVVFGEDHRLAADGPAHEVMADLELLRTANLLHEHAHRHGDVIHSHPHYHDSLHQHRHRDHR